MLKIVETKIHNEPTDHSTKSHFILAEGPRRSDAGFARQWLLSAIEADGLLQPYLSENPGFHVSIVRLECPYKIEFGPSAMAFIGMWQSENGSFSLDILDPEWSEIFCIMARLGFFKQTGRRYQMTIPNTVEIDRIKEELLRLTATQDSDYRLHPEELLTTMSQQQAIDWKRKLKRMNWQKRLADRDALLAE
jgi:hypothetical protein